MYSGDRHTYILASISVALLLIATGVHLGKRNREPTPYVPPVIPTQNDRAVFDDIDSDGDLLPDWQEFLIGTDPQNSDTDGNGEQDRLPNEITDGLVSTTTEELVDRLLTFYTSMKSSGTYTPEAGFDLAEELSSKLDVALAFKPFLTAEAKTKQKSKEVYATEVRKTLAPLYAFDEPDIGVYARYLQNGDQKALGDLLLHAESYARTAEKLMLVAPPPDIVDDHVELANALSYFAVVLNAMVTYADDPMASLSLLRTYNSAEQYLGFTLGVLERYYKSTSTL